MMLSMEQIWKTDVDVWNGGHVSPAVMSEWLKLNCDAFSDFINMLYECHS